MQWTMTFAHASICIFSRNGSRICDWNFTYSIWHSGNSGKYFDTDRIIFCKSWDYGKIKSGDQCASIQTGCISSICYRRRKRIFLCQTDSGSNCADCNYLLVFRNIFFFYFLCKYHLTFSGTAAWLIFSEPSLYWKHRYDIIKGRCDHLSFSVK